jgi:hypothetical protein
MEPITYKALRMSSQALVMMDKKIVDPHVTSYLTVKTEGR